MSNDTFVSTALELADSGEPVVLVGTDADLLVMLVARTPLFVEMKQNCFCFVPDMKTKPAKVFNISAIQQAVGMENRTCFCFSFTP